jgi:hypothetical protein
MTERPAVALSPLQLARARKCDRDVKLHRPEALYDDLAHVVRPARLRGSKLPAKKTAEWRLRWGSSVAATGQQPTLP